jgi:hypothetical protein
MENSRNMPLVELNMLNAASLPHRYPRGFHGCRVEDKFSFRRHTDEAEAIGKDHEELQPDREAIFDLHNQSCPL